MKVWAITPVLFTLISGCDELAQQKQQPNVAQSAPTPTATESSPKTRFAFPVKSNPFPESSIALDTVTGQLCKTYAWKDSNQLPKGLPLCSELVSGPTVFSGATKAYKGFTYSFNGKQWVKGNKAQKYNDKGDFEPWSDDQYDPLQLYSKEEKAKRTLTQDQIRKVADQFGVTYEEARDEAKQQGYQVPR